MLFPMKKMIFPIGKIKEWYFQEEVKNYISNSIWLQKKNLLNLKMQKIVFPIVCPLIAV